MRWPERNYDRITPLKYCTIFTGSTIRVIAQFIYQEESLPISFQSVEENLGNEAGREVKDKPVMQAVVPRTSLRETPAVEREDALQSSLKMEDL